jgi:pyruvate kinase
MTFSSQKTKIVCTIGPSCSSPGTLEEMVRRGMGVARLNYAHGEPGRMAELVADLRRVAQSAGRGLTILADLAGPKVRVGELPEGRMELGRGETVTLAHTDAPGAGVVPVGTAGVVGRLRRGDAVYMNDGFIRVRVEEVDGGRAECSVESGGVLLSGKGLNVPGRDLGLRALTEADRQWVAFSAEHGVDALSVSFVRDASDVQEVRDLAEGIGYRPFIVAKIERSQALRNLDAILAAADGLMVARGDLGVETEIEEIALVQKTLIRSARAAEKPVITATQMLESMVSNPRPTRAEATDVANAVLDGSDCLMLSEETAVGDYPLEAVSTMARIASLTERRMEAEPGFADTMPPCRQRAGDVRDLVVDSIRTIVDASEPVAVVTPTSGGTTPRKIARHRMPVWVVAVTTDPATCRALGLSWGVHPVLVEKRPPGWEEFASDWLRRRGVDSGLVILTEGSSSADADAVSRMEIIRLD